MASSAGSSRVYDAHKLLRQLKGCKVDITTFLDDDFKPREPPNPDLPYHWLRESQPGTRILEPHEYPDGILSKILDLVKKAASVKDAKAALRTAIAARKASRGQVAFVVQVLPRDIDSAKKVVKPKASGKTQGRKRAADATTAETRASKKTNLCDQQAEHDTAETTSVVQQSCASAVRPSVITSIREVPEPLGRLLWKVQTLHKTITRFLTPASRTYFNKNQTEADLSGLILATMDTLRSCDPFDVEQLDLQERVWAHAQKHWHFRRSCDRVSKMYEHFHTEQGITLSDTLLSIFQEPLSCCPGAQVTQPPPPESEPK